MAAPTPAVRGVPTGLKIDDGFSTLITITGALTIAFWEKTVKPPMIDGGDPNNSTNMHNIAFRTMSPKGLKTLGPLTTVVFYDSAVLPVIITQINLKGTITVRFPDGDTLCFYGYLQKFEPADMKEGEIPEATITIIPTNWDYTLLVEASPVFTAHV